MGKDWYDLNSEFIQQLPNLDRSWLDWLCIRGERVKTNSRLKEVLELIEDLYV